MMRFHRSFRRAVCAVTGFQMALGAPVLAQTAPPYNPSATTGAYAYPAQPTSPATPTAAPSASPSVSPAASPANPAQPAAGTPIKQEELEQILAPLALYPDALLSQVLMASTYPIEVVQADRWVKDNKNLTGDPLATELEKQTWDPSVKSLVNFPVVLSNLSDKLDVTVKIGDAFIADQTRVMNTIQALRSKAQAAGSLKDSPEQKVIVEQAPATTTAPATQTIIIQPTNPQVIYVPTYNPTVVYGAWPYPSYPPYYYPPPPNYVASAALIGFGVGVACGMAWGYAWGGCSWGRSSHVDININRNININNTHINRNNYQANYNRQTARVQGGANTFQHNPAHRGGVAYRDQSTARQFGGVSSAQATQARDAYRGRADTGRQDIARGNADQFKANQGQLKSYQSRQPSATPQNRAGSAGSAGNGGTRSGGTRDGGTRSDAFTGVDRGGSGARASSQRGQASRSSSSARPSGGGRSGGGGARGGGGRR